MLDPQSPQVIAPYVTESIRACQVFFVENERSARRFFKRLWKDMPIDDYEWFTIHKAEADLTGEFRKKLREGKTIGIASEAGCPGIADPGQLLVAVAQQERAIVRPLVGPSALLLALMASGMNGQQFRFIGYLPIDHGACAKKIRELESESQKDHCTQIFIETPYRNQQVFETLLKTCKISTWLCLAIDLTGEEEMVRTKKIADWKREPVAIGKRPTVFLLLA
jgi:16S rRNA (cytidine1402-2'-O)-methyltransferase